MKVVAFKRYMYAGVHVIKNPAGTYSLVGRSIPRDLCDEHEPTQSDIMGSRVDHETGLVYRPRIYTTAREAFAAADASGRGCRETRCACAGIRAEVDAADERRGSR